MTKAARFTQADITRVLKGAKDAGFTRVHIAIDPCGNISMDASNEAEEMQFTNPLHRILLR